MDEDNLMNDVMKAQAKLSGLIIDEFKVRNKAWPTPLEALMFATQEIGEASDVIFGADPKWVRNNPQNKPKYSDEKLARELGDIIYMALVCGIVSGVSPLSALVNKLEEKIIAANKENENGKS